MSMVSYRLALRTACGSAKAAYLEGVRQGAGFDGPPMSEEEALAYWLSSGSRAAFLKEPGYCDEWEIIN